ncbi:putative RNA methylase [Bradyrhizobium sp. USDA 4472]
MSEISQMLEAVRRTVESSQAYESYAERHNIGSAANLTVTDAEIAASIAASIEDRIRNKVVVEIGGGIGLLSLYMAAIARRVYCIEANPMWAASFTHLLIEMKPKNLSYLFGAADEFVGCIAADVAVICTHSDVAGMVAIGTQLAKEAIDVYGEMIEANPSAFDRLARKLRALPDRRLR